MDAVQYVPDHEWEKPAEDGNVVRLEGTPKKLVMRVDRA